jgi:hypothetical protein
VETDYTRHEDCLAKLVQVTAENWSQSKQQEVASRINVIFSPQLQVNDNKYLRGTGSQAGDGALLRVSLRRRSLSRTGTTGGMGSLLPLRERRPLFGDASLSDDEEEMRREGDDDLSGVACRFLEQQKREQSIINIRRNEHSHSARKFNRFGSSYLNRYVTAGTQI